MNTVIRLGYTIFAGLILTGMACAATQSFTTSIHFLEPLSFNAAVNPDLGAWSTGPSGRDLVLNTDSSVGGTNAADYIGGAAASTVTVVGSAFNAIDIVANNFVANGGVSINNVPCKYGAAAATTCGGGGIPAAAAPTTGGTALLLGVDVVTTSAHVDGDTAAPTFDIVVSYN
jgi:hypothetical protein